MDAASLFNSANTYFVNEEYKEALKHYTCAIALQDDVADYLVHRAAAYLKLGQMKEALEDAEKALELCPGHHVALQRKGVSLFYQGEYGAAKQALEKSLQVKPNAEIPRQIWLRKCDAELSGSSLPLQGITAETSLTGKTSTGYGAASSSEAATGSEARAPAAPKPMPAATSASAVSAPSGTSISGRKKIRHEWYQSNTHVFITIFAKNVAKEDCVAKFNEQDVGIEIKLPGDDGDEFQLDLDLFTSVVPSGCKVEMSTMKIEVSLQKKDPGVHWGSLEKQAPVTADEPALPAYPTSNKAKRDWGQIDRDIENDLKNEKPEGDEALNKLFKEIYERADEETRRAMNKSFQTSGGTVLSTNWGEVSHADYEGKDRPTAPEGQEWKDWKDNKKQ